MIIISQPVEGLTLAAKNLLSKNGRNFGIEQQFGGNENLDSSEPGNRNLWCTYCKKPCHTKDRCWKLHVNPSMQNWNSNAEGMQQRGQGQANVTSIPSNDEANS